MTKFNQQLVCGPKLTFSRMNNFGLTKTPFRRPRRYKFIDGLNVKIRLTEKKSYGPGEFKQQYFSSVQVSPRFLPEIDPRLYINLVLPAK